MAASPMGIPQELLPAIAQVTSILLRKLSTSSPALGVGAPSIASSSTSSPPQNDKCDSLASTYADATTPFEELDALLENEVETASNPTSAPPPSSLLRDCIQMLQKYPDVVSPSPLFRHSDALPTASVDDQYARWRKLPVLTLASFADNRKHFISEETEIRSGFPFCHRSKTSQRGFFGNGELSDTPDVIARRALGTYATRLFLNPSSLDRAFTGQQIRGFKSKSRSSTGLGQRSQDNGISSTLDELRAKFDSRGSKFAGFKAAAPGGSAAGAATHDANKQSFSHFLRQNNQSPDVQNHLKVAFADGYATADSNMAASKQSGFWLWVSRLSKFFWGTLLLLIVLQLIVNGFDGISGVAGGASSLNVNKHEVNPEEVNVTFKDVKGVDEPKEELEDIVEFLKDPDRFSALGGRMPRGVLLVGKPGIGKTLLARAVAGEAGVPFFHASGSEFDEIFVGTGAKRVRQLFAAAKAKAPCVLFIDEIDSCGAKRTSSQLHPYANQTINQLLAEMDGFNKSEGVVVLGATNKRENLDPALLRPGRFDVEVQVWPPDLKGRTELFDHYLTRVKTDANEVNAESLAKKTVGFLGAQIANMVNQAAIKAARENSSLITMKDLEWALDKERMGPEKKNKIDDKMALRRTACHEAGHTIVNYFTKHSMPINKVTITPRGHTLGRLDMMQDREHDTTKGRLLASLDVALGGRIGEETMLGAENVATGASSDFDKATSIASQIVKSWGMSNAAGTRTYGEAKFLSESMKELVDTEIRNLLDESYARAKAVIHENSVAHVRLTEALLKYETLDAEDVKAVIEGRDPPTALKRFNEKNKELVDVDSQNIITQGLKVSGGAAGILPVIPPEKPRSAN